MDAFACFVAEELIFLFFPSCLFLPSLFLYVFQRYFSFSTALYSTRYRFSFCIIEFTASSTVHIPYIHFFVSSNTVSRCTLSILAHTERLSAASASALISSSDSHLHVIVTASSFSYGSSPYVVCSISAIVSCVGCRIRSNSVRLTGNLVYTPACTASAENR